MRTLIPGDSVRVATEPQPHPDAKTPPPEVGTVGVILEILGDGWAIVDFLMDGEDDEVIVSVANLELLEDGE